MEPFFFFRESTKGNTCCLRLRGKLCDWARWCWENPKRYPLLTPSQSPDSHVCVTHTVTAEEGEGTRQSRGGGWTLGIVLQVCVSIAALSLSRTPNQPQLYPAQLEVRQRCFPDAIIGVGWKVLQVMRCSVLESYHPTMERGKRRCPLTRRCLSAVGKFGSVVTWILSTRNSDSAEICDWACRSLHCSLHRRAPPLQRTQVESCMLWPAGLPGKGRYVLSVVGVEQNVGTQETRTVSED